MDNRFRFRAWDCKLKEYHKDAQNGINEYDPYNGHDNYLRFSEMFSKKRYVIEQCTGLTDINGVLVYANDILTTIDESDYKMRLFYSHQDAAYMLYVKENAPEFLEDFILENKLNLKISGNIHENPQLLKDEVTK